MAAGLAIRNIMYLSVLGRTREFAQLRTLGATNRQIRCIVSAERRRMTRSWLATGVLAVFRKRPVAAGIFLGAEREYGSGCGSFYLVRCLSFVPRTGQTGCTRVADGWLRQTAMLSIGQPRRKGRLVRPTSRLIAHHSAHLSPSAIGRRWLSSDQKKRCSRWRRLFLAVRCFLSSSQ